jgi:hypothetical protein
MFFMWVNICYVLTVIVDYILIISTYAISEIGWKENIGALGSKHRGGNNGAYSSDQPHIYCTTIIFNATFIFTPPASTRPPLVYVPPFSIPHHYVPSSSASTVRDDALDSGLYIIPYADI